MDSIEEMAKRIEALHEAKVDNIAEAFAGIPIYCNNLMPGDAFAIVVGPNLYRDLKLRASEHKEG